MLNGIDPLTGPWAPGFIVGKVFPGLRDGFFIEAGAGTGYRDESNTYILEKNYGWTGLCVEPNRKFFARLIELRSARCVNACLHDQDGVEVDFISASYYGAVAQQVEHFHGADGARDYASYLEKNPNYQVDVDGSPGSIEKMTARTLESLLVEMSHDGDVHYLSLDVEGGEVFVLNGYPFERNRLLSATVECYYFSGDHRITLPHCLPVREIMWRNGLVYMHSQGVDDVFVHADLLKARF